VKVVRDGHQTVCFSFFCFFDDSSSYFPLFRVHNRRWVEWSGCSYYFFPLVFLPSNISSGISDVRFGKVFFFELIFPPPGKGDVSFSRSSFFFLVPVMVFLLLPVLYVLGVLQTPRQWGLFLCLIPSSSCLSPPFPLYIILSYPDLFLPLRSSEKKETS